MKIDDHAAAAKRYRQWSRAVRARINRPLAADFTDAETKVYLAFLVASKDGMLEQLRPLAARFGWSLRTVTMGAERLKARGLLKHTKHGWLLDPQTLFTDADDDSEGVGGIALAHDRARTALPTGLCATALHIWVVLAMHTNENGHTFVGEDRVLSIVGCSRGQYYEHLSRLPQKNLAGHRQNAFRELFRHDLCRLERKPPDSTGANRRTQQAQTAGLNKRKRPDTEEDLKPSCKQTLKHTLRRGQKAGGKSRTGRQQSTDRLQAIGLKRETAYALACRFSSHEIGIVTGMNRAIYGESHPCFAQAVLRDLNDPAIREHIAAVNVFDPCAATKWRQRPHSRQAAAVV